MMEEFLILSLVVIGFVVYAWLYRDPVAVSKSQTDPLVPARYRRLKWPAVVTAVIAAVIVMVVHWYFDMGWLKAVLTVAWFSLAGITWVVWNGHWGKWWWIALPAGLALPLLLLISSYYIYDLE